jgi:ATP-dependent RNA helicase DeaD
MSDDVDHPLDAGGFADLALRPELLRALSGLGYEEPTPIQREAIPPLLDGRDLLGQAATGTGKTAAFALPILNHLAGRTGRTGRTGPAALVLVPTRELAMQVSEAVHRYGRHAGTKVIPVYGGQPIWRQLRELEAGVDVVVATPGRAVDHLNRGSLDLDHLDTVVLDEADEMLDMGFAEDLATILESAPTDRQTVLFSATLPPRIEQLARRHLRDPLRIQITPEAPEAGEAPRVREVAYVVARAHKAKALGRVLDVEAPTATIVFCRTRTEVDELTETLNGRGYRAEPLHGGMGQEQRDRVMARLRSGTAELLVATDVAARGLDIDQLTHVVNYDVPSAPDAYVHRIGRVGRAGREGMAITLAEPRERRMLENIERVTRRPISRERVPSVGDLRARRLTQVQEALRDTLLKEELEPFGAVVDALTEEFDAALVVRAAIKLAHDALGELDDEEIPEIRPERRDRPVRDLGRPDGRERGRDKPPRAGMAKLFVSLGRDAGIRPQDLVGAIAGESSLRGGDIGAIEIGPRFSLVEVPAAAAGDVIAALRGTTIKGRKATVRRDRGAPARR